MAVKDNSSVGTQELKERFGFHPGTEDTIALHEEVRTLALELADRLDKMLPHSREKALALTALQETAMWSNAAIAIHLAPLEA